MTRRATIRTEHPPAAIDPALQRFVEALARADARRDYREAKAREAEMGGRLSKVSADRSR